MPKMFTATQFYDISQDVRNICENNYLYYNITEAGLSAAEGLDAWLAFVSHVIASEISVNLLIECEVLDEIVYHGDEIILSLEQWSNVATALNRFQESGGSERNYFFDASDCFDADYEPALNLE
jgi:hypothetical protein